MEKDGATGEKMYMTFEQIQSSIKDVIWSGHCAV